MNFSEVPRRLARWLSPEPALAAPPDSLERIARLARDGRTHLTAARAAGDQRLPVAAAALYGNAIRCFLEARHLAAPEQPSPPAPADYIASSDFGKTDRGRDALHLLREEPIDDGWRGRGRAMKALAGFDRMVAPLAAGLYPVSHAEVRRLRMKRQIAAGLFALLAPAAVVRCATAPRNVALGKHVTASSVRFGAPQALVNGAIEWGTFGLHTGSGREWATIDLGKFYPLAFAEIYGRGDGHVESGLPLNVELSDDGVAFRLAGACADIFTQATPCVVNLARQRARFVRVTAWEIVLSEVEVYAAP